MPETMTGPGFWTPETLQPETMIDALDLHKVRVILPYWWAWCVISGRKLPLAYDMGCKTGYGCHIMSEQQEHDFRLVGLEGDRNAVESARIQYCKGRNVEFRRVSFEECWQPLLKGEQPHLMTCFHVYSRLVHRDLFLSGVAKTLHEDGWFLMALWSVADYTQFSQRLLKDRFLVRWSRDDMKELLQRFFRKVYTIEDQDFPGLDYVNDIHSYIASRTTQEKDWNELFGNELFACHQPVRSPTCLSTTLPMTT